MDPKRQDLPKTADNIARESHIVRSGFGVYLVIVICTLTLYPIQEIITMFLALETVCLKMIMVMLIDNLFFLFN